jgi:hypothetical protein
MLYAGMTPRAVPLAIDCLLFHCNALAVLMVWYLKFVSFHPQIMYVGSGPARQIIRQHEFYVKESKKHKAQHQGPSDKHHHIKFDALLTSYETVLADAGILKGIKWDSMVRSLPNVSFRCWHPLSSCPHSPCT